MLQPNRADPKDAIHRVAVKNACTSGRSRVSDESSEALDRVHSLNILQIERHNGGNFTPYAYSNRRVQRRLRCIPGVQEQA